MNKKEVKLKYGERKSRGSSVGMATGYRLDDRGSGGSIPGWSWEFFFYAVSRPALVPTQPPILWVPETLCPGVKRARRGTDHSPPPGTEDKNAWRYTSTPSTSSWHGA
jgi:hypothetical protein